MKIRPLHDRVIVKRLEEERTSPGGIVIPDTATLDAAALRAVRMPARDKFVPDDRSPTRP